MSNRKNKQHGGTLPEAAISSSSPIAHPASSSAEIGGRKGPDPTRYGDWEKDGRCVDF